MSFVFAPLAPEIDRKDFTCGDPALDAYLLRQAGQDIRRGFATVIALIDTANPTKIIGFYTLAAASILLEELPSEIVRKFPRYPYVPAVRLGRLAVATAMQGKEFGSMLIFDALHRACLNELAWAVFLVDAKNNQVMEFYKKFNFNIFKHKPLSLWIDRKQALKIISI